jgi:hypothetical protein
MSKHYRFLNLPEHFIDMNVFIEEYSKTLDPNKHRQWRLEGEKLDLLNRNVQEWFKNKDCEIVVGELFYTAPQNKIRWHIDVSGYSPVFDYVKFNFVWCNHTTHYMEWGNPSIPGYTPTVGYNTAGSPHMIFNPEEIITTESVVIDKPILVNVGVPHRAVNSGSSGRWCLSLIPKKNGNRISFDHALDIFSEYVLD